MLTANFSGAGLGFIPNWQFSADPSVNPFLNPHVKMPEGWTQAYTAQPVGAMMTPVNIPIPSPLLGARTTGFAGPALGYVMIDRAASASATAAQGALAGVGTWAWDHRKGLALGAVALVGLGLLGGLSAILK